MAKAAAKGKAKGPAGKAPAGKAGAKGKPRQRGTKTWAKILALVILFPFGAVLLPTTLVFFTMMVPTWVAYMTDRSKEKYLAATVGMMNFAGTLPAIITLWARGQSHHVAMEMIGDVFVWVVAYGAAFGGWLIFGFMPTLVGSYFRMTTDNRIRTLVKQQKALIAEWGYAVAEGIAVAPQPGDEGAEEDGEETEDEMEVTEAELVQPRAAR